MYSDIDENTSPDISSLEFMQTILEHNKFLYKSNEEVSKYHKIIHINKQNKINSIIQQSLYINVDNLQKIYITYGATFAIDQHNSDISYISFYHHIDDLDFIEYDRHVFLPLYNKIAKFLYDRLTPIRNELAQHPLRLSSYE